MLMRLLKTQANHFRTEAMNVRHSIAIVRCLRWMSANELHLFFNRLTELACTDSKHHLLRSLLSALQTFRQEDKCVLFVVVPNKGNTKKEELEHQEWLSQKMTPIREYRNDICSSRAPQGTVFVFFYLLHITALWNFHSASQRTPDFPVQNCPVFSIMLIKWELLL